MEQNERENIMKVEVITENIALRSGYPTFQTSGHLSYVPETTGHLTVVPDLTVDVLFSRYVPVIKGKGLGHKLDYLA